MNINLDWAFESSDHATISIEMNFDKISMGPGIFRMNPTLLEDPIQLQRAKLGIRNMLEQIPNEWDPHRRLEYLKVWG